MKRKNNLTGGILFILLGLFFLLWQFAPASITGWFDRVFDWPFYVIGVGLIFLLIAVATGVGGLAIPGSINAGVGLILLYQNLTGDWASWAYLWVWIPGLVGLGLFIGSLVTPDMRDARRTGLNMFLISTAVTLLLWSAFQAGVTVSSSVIWATVLILVGLYLLGGALFRKR